MTSALLQALVWHVILGLAGIVAVSSFFLLLTRREWNFERLKLYSGLGFLAFLGSWITGGYYYTTHYGKAVKPLIVEGAYPWAHQVIMEAKEHIFLFLPFLALTLFLVTLLSEETLKINEKLRGAVIKLAVLVVALGSFFALSGLVISGSVSKKSPNLIIRSFEECARAGFPIAESFPRRCQDQSGRIFVEPTP
jgi:hypothetical protein